MKRYESVTDFRLVPGVPVYVRLDQRAGHTFTEKLRKPFDHVYMEAIASAAERMVAETNPMVAYCQSDEISLVYECPEKMPFEGRLFKIQSVFASMVASAFMAGGLIEDRVEPGSEFRDAVFANPPSFDCRVCQMSLEECANMILWRQRDCVKNSITLAALELFSPKELERKNSAEKIEMMRSLGVDYGERYLPEERLGLFVRKTRCQRKLDQADLERIPERNRPLPDLFGDVYVERTEVRRIAMDVPLDDIANRAGVLFWDAKPIPVPRKEA